MRILLSGGGTGGHVYPILSVVSALRQSGGPKPDAPQGADRSTENVGPGPTSAASTAADHRATVDRPAVPPTLELCYVGEAGGIEEQLARGAAIPFRPIESGQIRGRAPWEVGRSLARMARGAAQCGQIMQSFRPDAALITGGYVTAPVAWAAWRRGVPLLIYLPDLTPGLAIRLTSRLAAAVAVSFPEVARWFPGKAVVTGYPVRPELFGADRAAARARLGLERELPVLLVFGGSRGARSINQALVAALPVLLAHCQVLHISGQLDWPWVADAAARLDPELRPRYHPHAYLHGEMVDALAAADLAVARAGASTLGEFPAVGLPSILVPYPYAGQHQDANAAYLAERGAAIILPDGQLADGLAPAVLELLHAPDRLAEMAAAARRLAHPDAAARIAAELYRLAGEHT